MSDALWPHQQREVDKHATDPARFLAWSPRTGKTRTIIESARYWVGTIIVVTPKTASLTWAEECRRAGHSFDNLAAMSTYEAREVLKDPNSFIIVNYDKLHDLEKELTSARPVAVVFDEAHKIKSTGAKRTRAAIRLGAKASYTRCLTGTPTPKDYTDLYAQCKALDGGRTFGKRIKDFEERYCIIEWVGGQFPRLKGYRNLDELRAKWGRIASRVTEEDAFGKQPEPLEFTDHIELGTKQRAAYESIKRGADGDLPHKLQQLMAAQQCAAGVWKEAPHDQKLYQAVARCEDAAEAGQTAVVFYKFEAEGLNLSGALAGAGLKAARLSGTTPLNERKQIQDALNNKALDVAVIQQQAGGEGVPFHADLAIFTSPDFNWGDHYQCRKRLFVPGKRVSYVYVEAWDTCDQFIRRVLKNKGDAQSALIDTKDYL